jgi:hypothetical protein
MYDKLSYSLLILLADCEIIDEKTLFIGFIGAGAGMVVLIILSIIIYHDNNRLV